MKKRTLNPEIKNWKRYVGQRASSVSGSVGIISGVKLANGRKVFFGKTDDGCNWQSRSPKLVD